FRVVGRARQRGVRLVRELRVNRHEAAREADDRVDPRAVPVRVLGLVRACRQAVRQEPLEHELAEAPACLWSAQEVLQRADVLRELADARALLAERAELAREVGERALRRTGLRHQLLLRRSERAL